MVGQPEGAAEVSTCGEGLLAAETTTNATGAGTSIYRGTAFGNEISVQSESGYVMSDAAREAFRPLASEANQWTRL